MTDQEVDEIGVFTSDGKHLVIVQSALDPSGDKPTTTAKTYDAETLEEVTDG